MEELRKAQEHHIYKIHQKAWKCIREYGLIEDGDKILIGLSGGKDSLALTEILGTRMKNYRPKFSLLTAHITISNIEYQSDLAYLEKFSQEYNIPFIHTTTSFDISTDHRKSPCFLCSWNRRKELFKIAKEHGCNKIALGHHQDDILETLLMNMTFQGAIGTMPPKLKMDKFDMSIIRPLALNSEAQMLELSSIRNYPKQVKNCPFEKESNRSEIKKVIQHLTTLNPNAKYNLWGSIQNIQTQYLPKKSEF